MLWVTGRASTNRCRHVQHELGFSGQLEGLPVALRGGTRTEVDHDVEDLAVGAAYELRLAGTQAEMKTPNDALARSGDAVLSEPVRVDAHGADDLPVEGAAEEPALVDMRPGFEQERASNTWNRNGLH